MTDKKTIKQLMALGCQRNDAAAFARTYRKIKAAKREELFPELIAPWMPVRIARRGWNGKEQYVEIGTDFAYCTYNGRGGVAAHDDIGGKALVFVGTRGSQVGWLASQADMLADDWYIVE